MPNSPDEPTSEEAPEWMVSYADMITILMSFFAVMFSMAMSKDAKRDVPMMKSLHRQFGVSTAALRRPPDPRQMPKLAIQTVPESHIRGRMPDSEPIDTSPFGDQATIGGAIYFNSAATGLEQEQCDQLRNLAKVLSSQPGKIEILARAFGQPRDADAKFSKNWKLAHARCSNTLQYLVSLGIDPERIRIGVAVQFDAAPADDDKLLAESSGSVEVFTLNDVAKNARAESTDRVRN